MSTESHLHKNSRKYFLKGIYFIVACLVLVGLQYVVFYTISVRKTVNSIQEAIDVKLLPVSESNSDSVFNELYKEKRWLETRLLTSKTDSISLSVNLKDSLLQLELKGVVLKTSKITDMEIEEFFHQLTSGAYYHLFATQAQADSALSTIQTKPLVVKNIAIGTPAENSGGGAVDTTKTEIVHWKLVLNNGIILRIEGTDQYPSKEWWMAKRYRMTQNAKLVFRDIKKTIVFEAPGYQPEICITVSKVDARALYRALPKKPFVCIRL